MKLIIAGILILFLFPHVSAASCLTSSEEFATEVVLPHYDLSKLNSLGQMQSGAISYPAAYGSSLIALIKETTFPTGLSLRLQLPTRLQEIQKPYLKLTSYSASENTQYALPSFAQWVSSCTESSCRFSKGSLLVSYSKERPSETVIEFNQGLDSCSSFCSGTCVSSTTRSLCIDATTQRDLDALVKYTHLGETIHELLTSYRISATEGLTITDVALNASLAVDWKEALKQEIVELKAQEVISLSTSDIEAIESLAARGQAGRNYRIVYDSPTGTWMYYDRTSDAVLTEEHDCSVYASPSAQEPESTLPDSYYLVPLVVFIASMLIIALLVVIARIIRSHSR